MIRLVDFFIRRYVFAISIFTAIVFFGLVAVTRVGVDLLPNFELSFVTVTTSYPGAGPVEVSRQVSEPIEDALSTLPGISSLSSVSFEGVSVVFVEFAASVNADQAAVDVSQRVNAVLGRLPSDAGSPSIQKLDPNAEPIMNVALTAEAEDLREVQRFAETVLEPELQRVLGVADVSVIGPIQREIQVLLDPVRLELYGLSAQQIASAITGNSLELPLGSLTIAGERILLAGRNTFSSIQQVEQLLIDQQRGLRVTDVAVVRDSSVDITAYTRLNGQPVILLEVLKQSGSNSVAAAQGVRDALARLSLPEGYQATIVADTTPFITRTVSDTLSEILRAVLVVSLIVFLFIGRLGSVASVVIAIPISFAGALILFGIFGFTFNIVTLLAVTVAVGLVVDDSIVVVESISRYRELGYDRLESVRLGVSEVSVAVLASTLSLLAVFLPISFLPGILGQFFAEFGLTLTATIVASYLEALFFLTVRMTYFADPMPPSWREFLPAVKRFRADMTFSLFRSWRYLWFWLLYFLVAAGVGAWLYFAQQWRSPWLLAGLAVLLVLLPVLLGLLMYVLRLLMVTTGALGHALSSLTDWSVKHLREGYGNLLGRALNNSTAVLLGAVLLFVSVFAIAPRIGFNFTPALDSGQISVSLRLPTGISLDTTNELSSILEAALSSKPEVQLMLASVGVSSGDLGSVATSNRANFVLELVPKSQRTLSNRQLAEVWQKELRELLRSYPEARLNLAALDNAGPPDVSAYSITLASNDLELLRERDQLARTVLETSPYLANLRSDLDSTVSERVFNVNQEQLVGSGLSIADVYQTLRAYNVGIEAAKLRNAGDEFPVQVRVNPAAVRDEQGLLSLRIYSQTLSQGIPLGELGQFSRLEVPSSINRINQTYTSTIRADVNLGAPPSSQLREGLRAELETTGVFGGAVSEGRGVGLDLTSDLILYTPIAFALAFLLNYLVIASQFNSFKFPVYLLLTVPLALVGTLWVFFLTGTALDVNSVLGVVILTGLVTKNAILLLDLVVNRDTQQSNESLRDLLIRAGKVRLRPILMTTLTLVAISLPLLLGVGDGSEFRQPLGLVIFAGVTISALLTLFVIPSAFYRFERKRFAEPPAQDKASPPHAQQYRQATSTD